MSHWITLASTSVLVCFGLLLLCVRLAY